MSSTIEVLNRQDVKAIVSAMVSKKDIFLLNALDKCSIKIMELEKIIQTIKKK